jgi:hypothetical protein
MQKSLLVAPAAMLAPLALLKKKNSRVLAD